MSRAYLLSALVLLAIGCQPIEASSVDASAQRDAATALAPADAGARRDAMHFGAYDPSVATLPINLGGGGGVVSGVLPAGNQASQNLSIAGDVTCSGTTTSTTGCNVASISGSSPINVTPSVFQWVTGASPSLQQATTTNPTGQPLSIRSQMSTNGNAQGAPIQLQLEVPAGTGSEAYATAQRCTTGGSCTTQVQIGTLAGGGGGYGAVYLGALTPSSSNYALISEGSSITNLNAPSGGTLSQCVGNTCYVALTSSSVNEFSSANVQLPWQGSNTGQTATWTLIPFLGQTSSGAAQTLYTYALATSKSVLLKVEANFQRAGTSGGAGCVGEFFNNAGTISQAGSTVALWGISSASCSFAISGTNVLVQGASSVSATVNWQGTITASVN